MHLEDQATKKDKNDLAIHGSLHAVVSHVKDMNHCLRI